MKRFSVKALLFLFAVWVCACERVESTYISGPDRPATPTVAAAEAEDTTTICNATLFTKGETCFRVSGGGLGAIDLRDIMKTNIYFFRYEAYEGVVAATGELAICFDLYESADPYTSPFSTECYSWDLHKAAAVMTTAGGKSYLGYIKK